MTVLPSSVADSLDAEAATYRDYVSQVRSNALSAGQQAAQIAQYRLAAPGLPAEAYLSFAANNVPADQVASLQHGYVADGSSSTLQYQSGPNGQAQVGNPATVAKHKSDGGGGLLGTIMHGAGSLLSGAVGAAESGVENASGALGVPQVGTGIENATKWVNEEIAKPAVRWGGAALSAPMEVITNEGGALLGQVGLTHNAGNPFSADVLYGTTLSRMIDDVKAGTSVGTGYMPPQSARADAAVIQRDVRGTVAGHAATLGRIVATNILHLDNDSLAAHLVSGAVDLGVTAKADPVNWINKGWHGLRVDHETFAVGADAERIANSAGITSWFRKSVNPQVASEWVQKDRSLPFREMLALTERPSEVYSYLGGAGTRQVWRNLANAQTVDEVNQEFLRAVNDGLLRDVPKTGSVFGPAGVIRQTFRDSRMLAMVPDRFINPDGLPEQAVQTVDRAALNAKLGWSVRRDLLDHIINLPDDPELYRAGLEGVAKNLASAMNRKIAGEGWWQGGEGEQFVRGLAASADRESLEPIRNALDSVLPGHGLPDEALGDLNRVILGKPSVTDRAQRALDYLSAAEPELDYGSKTPGSPRLGSLFAGAEIRPGETVPGKPVTVAGVRDWMAQAFPDHTFDDATARGLARIASSSDADRFERIRDWLSSEIPLGRAKADPKVAQSVTRFAQNQLADQQAYWLHAGGPDSLALVDLGHGPEPIVGPALPNDVLRHSIELPDYRTIRRTTGMFANLLGASPDNGRPYFSLLTRPDGQERALLQMFEQTTRLWRTLAVMRPAITSRIVGSQQLAGGVDGLETFANHPFNALARAIRGKDIPETINGDAFIDQSGEIRDSFAQALGTNARGQARYDRYLARRFGPISISNNPTEGLDAWAGELGRLSNDPTTRAVAAALAEKDPQAALSEVVRQFTTDGERLNYQRLRLLQSEDSLNPSWRSGLATPAGADAYIRKVVAGQLAEKAVDDPALLQMVATGEIAGAHWNGNGIPAPLKSKLGDLYDEGNYPSLVKGLQPMNGLAPSQLRKYLDRAHDAAWRWLVTVPSSRLTAVPLAEQLYSQEVARVLGTSKSWRDVLDAVEHGDTTSLASIVEGGPSHLTAAEVDALAKAHVANTMGRYVYQLHDHAQITDMLRTIIPFGEVFRQELARWTRLSADNLPTALHRSTQAITNARSSGLFYRDPTTGEEMMHTPLAAIGGRMIGDPGIDLGEPVKGLNIVGQGLPGIGPVAAVGADKVLQAIPDHGTLRKILEPYGPPDFSRGGVLGVLTPYLPSWLQKITSAVTADPQRDSMFAGALADATIYLRSSDDPNNPKYPNSQPGYDKLHSDATALAQRLLIFRGLAQSALPSAPRLNQQVKVGDKWMAVNLIAQDYRNIATQTINGGGTLSDATGKFVAKYGLQNSMAMIPETIPRIYGLSATKQLTDWQTANGGFTKAYKNVWPLFGPAPLNPDGSFDYFSYLRQRSDGQRMVLSWDQATELNDYRIGSWLYDTLRNKLPVSLSTDQRQGLQQVKLLIGQTYPGYGKSDGQYPADIPPKVPTDVAIRELANAVDDPAVAKTQVAQATKLYLMFRRNAALGAGANPDGANPFRAATYDGLRAGLRQAATLIAQQYPAFGNVWEYLLSREAEDPTQPQGTTP